MKTTNGYLVLGAINPKMVLCTDGEFRALSMTGPNGYCAKVYKTKAGAKRSWPSNPLQAYAA